MITQSVDESVHFMFQMLHFVPRITIHGKTELLAIQNINYIDYNDKCH